MFGSRVSSLFLQPLWFAEEHECDEVPAIKSSDLRWICVCDDHDDAASRFAWTIASELLFIWFNSVAYSWRSIAAKWRRLLPIYHHEFCICYIRRASLLRSFLVLDRLLCLCLRVSVSFIPGGEERARLLLLRLRPEKKKKMAQAVLTALDTLMTRKWREQERTWRKEKRQWREEDMVFREEECAFHNRERELRNLSLR